MFLPKEQKFSQTNLWLSIEKYHMDDTLRLDQTWHDHARSSHLLSMVQYTVSSI